MNKLAILFVAILLIAGCGSEGTGQRRYSDPDPVITPVRESMYGTHNMWLVTRWDATGEPVRCSGDCGSMVVSPTETIWTVEDFGWSEVTPTIEVWPGELVYAPLQSDFWYGYVDDDYQIIFYEKRSGFWIHYYLRKVSDEY